jgi:coenzyme F420-reducing hydrogenase beta subunit
MSVTNIKAPAFKIIGIEKCTGCFGCQNSCKLNAIKMIHSEDGFYFPQINEELCNNCGKCANNCPVLNSKITNFSKQDIKTYAAFSNDDTTRLTSSSGGIFTQIAQSFIEDGAVVYGAAWNGDLNVNHIGVKNIKSIYKLRSSKYVQSNLNNIYSEIVNKYLKNGVKVLFSGTPCQVAALKTFTDSVNLFTVDVVCHGIPSKVIFDEYIKYISKGNKVVSYNFRDKSIGWSKYKVRMQMENGEIYECITRQDPFFQGFICDLYSNLPCYNCKFASIPRTGDLTLGDFWKISEDLMDERGVSVVLSNNKKGLKLLLELENNNKIKLFSKTLDDAILGNARIHDGFLKMRKKRSEILKECKKQGFEYIYKNYIKVTKRYVPDK